MSEPAGETRRTVLFVDLAGYSALTEAHGDIDAADVADRLGALGEAACGPGVRLVKSIGDAIMIAARSPVHAIETALGLLVAAEREPLFPALRIGINEGPVVERGGDLFGSTVNVAARVTSFASPGQVLCTEGVAGVAGQAGGRCEPAGEVRARNIPGSIRLFSIHPQAGPIQPAPVDPVCRMGLGEGDVLVRVTLRGDSYVFCSTTCADLFEQDPDSYVPHR